MSNAYVQLLRLLPGDALQYAEVVSTTGAHSVVQMPGGAQVTVRGTAQVGQAVFIRGGSIDAEAPNLPLVSVTV